MCVQDVCVCAVCVCVCVCVGGGGGGHLIKLSSPLFFNAIRVGS